MPRKVRELIKELEKSGFVNRGGTGSHRNFIHTNYPIPVVISGKPGSDAKAYQEKALRKAIHGVSK